MGGMSRMRPSLLLVGPLVVLTVGLAATPAAAQANTAAFGGATGAVIGGIVGGPVGLVVGGVIHPEVAPSQLVCSDPRHDLGRCRQPGTERLISPTGR